MATRRDLRRQRRERWVLAAVATALLLALLTAAVLVVGRQHQASPVTGSPGTIAVPLSANLP